MRKFGGASRDRTDDLIVANDALSQLSYSPTSNIKSLTKDAGVSKMRKGIAFLAQHNSCKTIIFRRRAPEHSALTTLPVQDMKNRLDDGQRHKHGQDHQQESFLRTFAALAHGTTH